MVFIISGMSVGLTIQHIGLALTAFLIVLNGYLRGREKAKIEATLSLLWLVLLGIGFFVFGWKAGLLGLVMSFVYALAARPFAARVAQKLLRYRTTMEASSVEPAPVSVEALLTEAEKEEERLNRIAQRPEICKVLNQYSMGEQDLQGSVLVSYACGSRAASLGNSVKTRATGKADRVA